MKQIKPDTSFPFNKNTNARRWQSSLRSKDTNQFIGSSGLHNPNWDVPKFEIGYWIDARYSGNGYMTEAVQRICEYAFNELKARSLEIRDSM